MSDDEQVHRALIAEIAAEHAVRSPGCVCVWCSEARLMAVELTPEHETRAKILTSVDQVLSPAEGAELREKFLELMVAMRPILSFEGKRPVRECIACGGDKHCTPECEFEAFAAVFRRVFWGVTA